MAEMLEIFAFPRIMRWNILRFLGMETQNASIAFPEQI